MTEMEPASEVQQKANQEYFHAVYKTQNQDLPPSGPFSQILSHLVPASINAS